MPIEALRDPKPPSAVVRIIGWLSGFILEFERNDRGGRILLASSPARKMRAERFELPTF